MTLNEKAKLLLSRFKGREDVYAKKWYDKEGKGNYAPVCNNFFTAKCPIKLNTGSCATCTIVDHEPISEASIIKHITGVEEHAIFVVRTDGMVYYGAFDFDCKPGGKADSTYYWEDVRKTCDVLDQLGIKYGIARSTTDGFHVYMFFAEPYSAHKFAQIVMKLIFKLTGFEAERANGIRKFPEFFPKQASVGLNGFGNSIKPPMVESRWDIQRNCFVNNSNEMINIDQQWNHLRDIQNNTPEHFDSIIELYGIQIDGIRSDAPDSKKAMFEGGGVYDFEHSVWQKPHSGSIEKVIEGCAAFRRMREKMDRGEVLTHQEGFALFHTGGMATRDGWDYFKNGKVPGWSKTAKDENQLMQSFRKNYKPWTCKAMQAQGICTPGTKCFEKRPPVKIRDGREYFDTHAPIEEWPDPSPIRYARGDGEDFLKKLLTEVTDVAKLESIEQKSDAIKKIALRAQVFDKDQQSVLRKAISDSGLAKSRELNSMFSKAEKEKIEETERILGDNSDTIKEVGVHYKKKKPYGYQVARKIKSNDADYVDLCSFDFWIRETVDTKDEGETKSTIYKCSMCFAGIEKTFDVPADKFFDNTELYKLIGIIGSSYMTLKKEDLSDARVAWQIFSRRRGISEKVAYATQGWHDDAYMMPETIVDKLGVRSNTDKLIDVPVKGNHARGLGFVYLTEEENKSTLFHIKNEFFKTFPRGPLFIGLGHTFLAATLTPLNIKKRPTLWYEGLTGRGKSELTILLQQFFGKFENLQNWTGTEKGIIDYCHRFKDAVLVVDDYKAKDRNQIAAAAYAIQYGYDGGSRSSLTKTSEQRGDKGSRCLLICSGEDTPFGDASVIARMLLIPYPKTEMKTKDLLDRCKDNQHLYSGVMSYFIHYFLNHDLNNIKKQIRDITDELLIPVRDMQNSPRICENFSMNYVIFKLFVEFMEYNQILNTSEVNELKIEHMGYVRQYRDVALYRCASEQQSMLFLSILREVVQSNRMSIAGLHGHERENAKEIGFVKANDDKYICIYPNLAVQAVRESSEAFSSRISQNAIGEQLVASGVIDDFDTSDASKTKMMINPRRNSRVRVWLIKADALGVTEITLKALPSAANSSFPFSSSGGLI